MSIPKEPRQQMINMMYLVLTAILALNVSAEVLNAFGIVNEGIDASTLSMADKNEVTYNLLEELRKEASAEELVYINRADQVRELSDELFAEVQSLKEELIEMAGGITDEGKLKKEDDLNVATNLMVNQEQGLRLQQIIKDGKAQFMSLIDEEERGNYHLPMTAEDPAGDKHGRDWATKTFEGIPAIAAVTILNQIQGDIEASEAVVANHLVDKVRLQGIKFDALKAGVFPNSSYVLSGERYKATIFPTAFSTTEEGKVYIGTLDENLLKLNENGSYDKVTEFPMKEVFQEIDTDEGEALYEFQTTGAGIRSYEGAIEMVDQQGNKSWYPFKSEYTVATSSAVVSPTKMNVLYIGVQNPISVSVPGIQAENVSASISSGSLVKQSNGSYLAEVTGTSDVTVNVTAKMQDGSVRFMGSMQFRVKRPPAPKLILGNKSGGVVSANWAKAQMGPAAILEDFLFEGYRYNITGFTLKVVKKGEVTTRPINGTLLPDDMKQALGTLSDGDLFTISEVKVVGPGNNKPDVGAMSFEIKN